MSRSGSSPSAVVFCSDVSARPMDRSSRLFGRRQAYGAFAHRVPELRLDPSCEHGDLRHAVSYKAKGTGQTCRKDKSSAMRDMLRI